jgi:hypothetical protein
VRAHGDRFAESLLLFLHSAFLILPPAFVSSPAIGRCGSGVIPAIYGCVSHVGHEIACVCRRLCAFLAVIGLLCALCHASPVQTPYCCRVCGLDCSSRRPSQTFASDVMQAGCEHRLARYGVGAGIVNVNRFYSGPARGRGCAEFLRERGRAQKSWRRRLVGSVIAPRGFSR